MKALFASLFALAFAFNMNVFANEPTAETPENAPAPTTPVVAPEASAPSATKEVKLAKKPHHNKKHHDKAPKSKKSETSAE